MKKEELMKFINDSYPIAITFDTSFIQKENYNFKTGQIYKLHNLKKYGIKIILHDIVYEELKKHIKSKISNSLDIIKKTSKAIECLDINKLIPCIGRSSEIMSEKTDEYTKNILSCFIKDFNIEKISYYYENIVEEVFRSYFGPTAPFSNGKKEEFPDAFTLMAIEHWSSQNDILTICISCDKDWEEYCKNSEYLFYSKNVSYLFETLFKDKIERDERTELIKGNIDKFKQLKHEQLANEISYAVENTNNFNLDYESSYGCDCEINNTILNNYNIKSYEILSIDDADNDTFTYDISFNVLINIIIEYSYEIYIYDSIDKDYITLSSGHRTIDTNVKIDVSIEFEGDNGDIINIYNIDIPNTNIDIGSVELGDEFYCSDDEE